MRYFTLAAAVAMFGAASPARAGNATGSGSNSGGDHAFERSQAQLEQAQRQMKAAQAKLETEHRRWVEEHLTKAHDPKWDEMELRHAELVARHRRLVEDHASLVEKARQLQGGLPAEQRQAEELAIQAEHDRLEKAERQAFEEDTAMIREHDQLAAKAAPPSQFPAQTTDTPHIDDD
jgi:hypothetical protein